MIHPERLRELISLYSYPARGWDTRTIPVSRLISISEVIELAEHELFRQEAETIKRLTAKNGRGG